MNNSRSLLAGKYNPLNGGPAHRGITHWIENRAYSASLGEPSSEMDFFRRL